MRTRSIAEIGRVGHRMGAKSRHLIRENPREKRLFAECSKLPAFHATIMPNMLRLTREVRFSIPLDRTAPADGGNGHAGRPALDGIGCFVVVRLTLEGAPDPSSGYLRNIKDIDAAARQHAYPALCKAVADGFTPHAMPRLLVETIESNDGLAGANIVACDLLLSPYLSLGWTRSEPAMIRLSQKFEFSAAHRLHNPALDAEQNIATFGKCNNPFGHGHNYEVQVTVAGVPDDKSGQLIGTAELERIVDEHVIKPLDHKHLNVEVHEFQELNPSVEHIAMVIHRRLAPVLVQTKVRLASVTVWETPKTWAEYSEA